MPGPGRRFLPGNNANPNGRPPKDRTLAAILEAAGGRRVDAPDGTKVQRQRAAAEHIWDLLAFGRTSFPGLSSPFFLGGRDWVELAKWTFTHIDGPAPTKLEHSSDPDRPMTIRVEYDDADPIGRAGADLALATATLLPGPDVPGGEAV